ncbi:MAG: hypothetical protein K8R59_11905 [Thermoanaerobaculales bacterium]|nr:hypothetical protein [Thermoanaerobaculales bacterium]
MNSSPRSARAAHSPCGFLAGSNRRQHQKPESLLPTALAAFHLRVNLFDVHFRNELDGFAVGQTGTILATDDGGAHWLPEASPTEATLNTISFLGPDQRWIGGAWGAVLGPPSCLFADGFELGNTSAWSSVTP